MTLGDRWLRHTPLDAEHAQVLDRIRRWLGDNRLLPYNPTDWDLRVFETPAPADVAS